MYLKSLDKPQELELNREVRSEAYRKLAESDEEMERIKRNMQRLIDSSQGGLNSARRDDAGRMERKIERDTNERKFKSSAADHWAVEALNNSAWQDIHFSQMFFVCASAFVAFSQDMSADIDKL